MPTSPSSLNQTRCHIRQVRWSFPALPCPHCTHPAPRTDHALRVAIDIDLDLPVLVPLTVSRHHCPSCHRYFRAQPPFLRPDASYTNRVVQKAVQSVSHDGMAMRRVAARLARDFWVRPSEASIRRWCRDAPAVATYQTEYQPWVIGQFSGILCIDEAYQDQLALLLAVDPAQDGGGDHLVGYQLVSGAVRHDDVRAFLQHLKDAGVEPDEVVTDASALYPQILAEVWPQAAHQLCLFHATRRVTAAVQKVYRQVRATLPKPPQGRSDAGGGESDAGDGEAATTPAWRLALHGRPHKYIPAPDPDDPAFQRYQARQDARVLAIAQVHALHHSGLSLRAVAKQTGLDRTTVRKYIREPAPDLDADLASLSGEGVAALSLTVAPPPAPWTSWAQVRQVGEDLSACRFLLLRRPDHLTAEEQTQLDRLLASPIGADLRTARSFLEEWYGLWRDEHGQRRCWDDAQARYLTWQATVTYHTLPPLATVLTVMDAGRFQRVSQFLRHPAWEATSNGAERAGRAFRHLQGPHFNLRSAASIEQALAATALVRFSALTSTADPPPNRSARGRPAKVMAVQKAAA